MTRASRRGDTAHWMNSRRKEYERIDTMCQAESNKMHDKQRTLCDLLHHATHDGRKVLVAEAHGPRHILLLVSRPGATKGTDEILLRIEDHE